MELKVINTTYYTNFILPLKMEIINFISLKKLKQLKISIYGHDEDSFIKISKSKSYKINKI